MVLMAVRSRPVAAKWSRTFWTVKVRQRYAVRRRRSELTDVSSWPTFGRDHHVLEFLEIKAFARHDIHGMIQHLTCRIGVLDLVP